MGAPRILLIHSDSARSAPVTPECAVSRFGADRISLREAREIAAAPALIILEARGTCSWRDTLQALKRRWEATPFLGVFDEPPETEEAAAFSDFLCAPVREAELSLRVKRLLTWSPTAGELDLAQFKRQHHLELMLGESEAFASMLRRIPALAAVDATVLIAGETGTGKELVARALHYSGRRRNGPFVPCNCGALPDHLIENELFGHAAGAYTDARGDQKGLVAIADGGTLFLDEVDGLSWAGQTKLLRFLQDREYRPLGSSEARRANVRLLAATNSSLADAVARRTFREDLYHRLNVLRLTVPALRDRATDIPLLAQRFLERFVKQNGGSAVRFSGPALEALSREPWRGNIRELESVVQRAAILCTGQVVEVRDLELLHAMECEPAPQFEQAKRTAIESFEKGYLTRLLAVTAGNVSRAARSAGKERRTFQRLLRKHGLTPAQFHVEMRAASHERRRPTPPAA